MMAAERQCAAVGRSAGAPFRRQRACAARAPSTRAPAVAYRAPAASSGGRVSIITAMAK